MGLFLSYIFILKNQKISIHLEIALFYPKTLDNINSFIIEVIINKVFIILLGGSLALFRQYGFNSILNIITENLSYR